MELTTVQATKSLSKFKFLNVYEGLITYSTAHWAIIQVKRSSHAKTENRFKAKKVNSMI